MSFGIVFTRHVNSEKTNEYWKECYRCIRNYYPKNTIMIIDDNSNQQYIKNDESLLLTNCFFIESEFPGCGELLSYYYFHKYKLFDHALIIHDSTFLNRHIEYDLNKSVEPLWEIIHDYDNPIAEKEMINNLKNPHKILEFYDNKNNWIGFFGVQSVISLWFLEQLEQKHGIFRLVPIIKNRDMRYPIERIFGLLCCYDERELIKRKSIFGNIYSYIYVNNYWNYQWGYNFDSYEKDKINKKYIMVNLPIIKVWSGR